jgi:hypothetical protein
VLDWTTASELDTVGFNLYRGEAAEGPLTQVNTDLIPSQADPFAGTHYTYTDETVTAGRTYYYYLEDVDLQGQITRHGPQVAQAGPPQAWWWAGGLALAGGAVAWLRRGM